MTVPTGGHGGLAAAGTPATCRAIRSASSPSICSLQLASPNSGQSAPGSTTAISLRSAITSSIVTCPSQLASPWIFGAGELVGEGVVDADPVGVVLAVGEGVGDAVGVGDGVGEGLGVGDGDGDGVGTGVGPLNADSYAPISQRLPSGRATPRWSVAGGGQSALAKSIAGLPARMACVLVEPGAFSASGPRFAL
jgi:hypothetical protein